MMKGKSAAVLLFGKNPRKHFTTAYIKIGRFGTFYHDLLSQDIIEGSVLTMADKVLDVLRVKYLVSPVRHEGLQRIEEPGIWNRPLGKQYSTPLFIRIMPAHSFN